MKKMENLKTENLVELHEQLDEFAKHHQNKGGQEAHKLVKSLWDANRKEIRDGSSEGVQHDKGFDAAFKYVLGELHKRFVP